MSLFDLVFGHQATQAGAPGGARLPVIEAPPPAIVWRNIRARKGRAVRARLAEQSGVLDTKRGPARYQAGEHYIVEHGGDDRAVVGRDVFERTYQRRPDGAYEKRTDIPYRYFTLPYSAMVRTLEGFELAKARDWIVEGVNGELWPVAPKKGREVYEPASA
jgi:hypothetical protein